MSVSFNSTPPAKAVVPEEDITSRAIRCVGVCDKGCGCCVCVCDKVYGVVCVCVIRCMGVV